MAGIKIRTLNIHEVQYLGQSLKMADIRTLTRLIRR